MELGLVGLGRMGGNMRERLRRAGHTVYGYARRPDGRDVDSLSALVEALGAPRAVWLMIPAGEPTRMTIAELADLLEPGDLVVEGGNSRWTDDLVNAELLGQRGVARLIPIFDALRPEGPREEGFAHAGPVGSGHFAKMVHNGIEYGLMQAYAEGFELLAAAAVVENVPAVLKAWSRGTVVRSWLLDLLVAALEEDPQLTALKGYVEDSGEGRWTIEEAINHAVPAPVMSAALFARFASRQEDSPAMKAVAALRQQFGGHAVQRADVAGPSSGAGDVREDPSQTGEPPPESDDATASLPGPTSGTGDVRT
jgi:6-phosphogluconate dehydrogenase